MGKHTSEQKKHAQIVQLLQDGQYFFHKGLKAYKERNLKRASKLIQRAVHLEPNDSEMLSWLAVIYSEMGHYQQSNELFDFILVNLKEEMPECHYFKANNFAHLGLFQEAYKEAAAYSDADPDGEFSEEIENLMELLDFGEAGENESLYDQDELLIRQDRQKRFLRAASFMKRLSCLKRLRPITPSFGLHTTTWRSLTFTQAMSQKRNKRYSKCLRKMKAISMPCATSLYSAITRGKMKKSEN